MLAAQGFQAPVTLKHSRDAHNASSTTIPFKELFSMAVWVPVGATQQLRVGRKDVERM